MLILPLQFEVENRLKRTRKSTEPYFADTLLTLSPIVCKTLATVSATPSTTACVCGVFDIALEKWPR